MTIALTIAAIAFVIAVLAIQDYLFTVHWARQASEPIPSPLDLRTRSLVRKRKSAQRRPRNKHRGLVRALLACYAAVLIILFGAGQWAAGLAVALLGVAISTLMRERR